MLLERAPYLLSKYSLSRYIHLQKISLLCLIFVFTEIQIQNHVSWVINQMMPLLLNKIDFSQNLKILDVVLGASKVENIVLYHNALEEKELKNARTSALHQQGGGL